MKKILIIGLSFNIGGIETSIMNYYRNIDKNKYSFDFISMFDKLAFEDEIIKNGSKVIKIKNFKNNPFEYYKQLKKIMNEGNYDAVHINMLSAANILPIKAAKKCKIKNIIVHSHNGGTPKGVIRKILHTINRNVIRKNANTFLACSQLAGEWLFGKDIKFDIINNAIDLEKYKYDESVDKKIRKKYNILNDEILIGHVGRFFEQKNHSFLIDVFHELKKINPKYKLILIGDGELKEEIVKKVDDLKLTNDVIFTGTVMNVHEYYSAMNLFLLPSLFEGSPMVLIESQASGLSCYVSDTITKESNVNGKVNYFSINNESKKIAEFINNNLVFNDRNEEFLKMLDSKYNIKKQVDRLVKYYD